MPRSFSFYLLILMAICGGGCEKAEEKSVPTFMPEPLESTEAAVEEGPPRPVLEKDSLILGVTPHLASTPLMVALAQGFFAEEGLAVSLQPFTSSEELVADIREGSIDGGVVDTAFFLVDSSPDLHNLFGLGVNQDTIGVSRAVWERIEDALLRDLQGEPVRPIDATVLELLARERVLEGRPLTFAVESPHASAHFLLRYWLAAAGLQPVKEEESEALPAKAVRVSTMRIDEIGRGLASGELDGFAIGGFLGRPFVREQGGRELASGVDVFADFQGQGFGMASAWIREHPAACQAVLRALIRAGQWLLASEENRREAVRQCLATLALDGDFDQDALASAWRGAEPSDFLPSLSSGIWVSTQRARWRDRDFAGAGGSDESRIDERFSRQFFSQGAEFLIDAELLEDDGWLASAPAEPTTNFIDGELFDPRRPEAYLPPGTTKPEAGAIDQ